MTKLNTRYRWPSSYLRLTRSRALEASLLFASIACLVGTSAAHATIASTPHYVPAQNIPCSYGLSADDLKSAGPAITHAPRPNAIVRASVDERGQIADAVVEVSSGNPAFDNLALQAARRAQCRPFTGVDNRPVAVETNFNFDLPRTEANAAPSGAGANASAGVGFTPAANNPAYADLARLPSFPAGPASPSLLSTALPFLPGSKPLDATELAQRFGLPPDSSKAKLLTEWAQKLTADPDIRRAYLSSDNNPTTVGPVALERALNMVNGMARISQQDRDQVLSLTTRALNNAPPDCGGLRNLQQITSRYLSMETESDAELRAQLQAMFNLIKQSTQTTPPPTVTPGERLRGQLALSASIADTLNRDPSAADDLGLLTSGRQAELSPEAWCKAMRVYRHAFDTMPQTAREWITLGELDNSRRSTSLLITALKNLSVAASRYQAAAAQTASAPKVFDYAQLVRQRVQPNIVWNGKVDHRETVVEVHCTSTGNLESVKIVRSSGDRSWDKAAVEAIKRSDPMPRDENGETPRSFTITLRPGV
ncbi:TonB family protein [Paraburkholderia antibiotica]|uniref:TonB family protein n=1 Tax=Paraburkholderia antibiotica TaxID=2728839 RepID=A0A7X9ZWA0_9BURK|nr:TonB family protein [Paraburkholderia antibiotica]NML29365.1 TonB family protein [Paraburkholderia antibiotica]